MSVSPSPSPSVDMTIRDALSGVLGDYTSVEREVVVSKEVPIVCADGSGVETISLQQVDYSYIYQAPDLEWIGSFVLLTVVLVCFFKAVGGLLKCKV